MIHCEGSRLAGYRARVEFWDLWYPEAGSTGISFARCAVDEQVAGDHVLVHAAPPLLAVEVRDYKGMLVAHGSGLERHETGPMSLLVRNGQSITLEDLWPGAHDLGRLVILPGGEAGILREWWHRPDLTEWRWQVEFYNHT